MIPWPDTTRVGVQLEPVPDTLVSDLEEEERGLILRTSARDDTATVLVTGGDTGALLAYAVFGQDEGDMLTIYAARCLVPGLGPMALKSFLGVAQITGTPMRVHTERVQAMARAIGATSAMDAIDGDGLPMGVFR